MRADFASLWSRRAQWKSMGIVSEDYLARIMAEILFYSNLELHQIF